MRFELKTLSATQHSAVAGLFSAAVIRELALMGQSPMFSRLAKESCLVEYVEPSTTISSVFNIAFEQFQQVAYRQEYVYKAAIAHQMLLGKHCLNTASMITEFRVRNCKADVAILNGTSTVYEIKSERDNLERLESQIFAYRQFFASVNVIAGSNHIEAVTEMVPWDVGILELSENYEITTLREAEDKPERIIPESIFESVQRHEAIKILKLMHIEIPEVPNTLMHSALREKFLNLDATDVHKAVLSVLKETRSKALLSEYITALPCSLRAAAISTSLKRKDYSRLLEVMDTPFSTALKWA